MTRLIDADVLDEAMYHKSFETDDGRQKWHSGLWIRYKIYEEASREVPTVDSVPIEFIKKKIDKYREIEDQAKDDPLSEYFELERYSLEWLLVDWKAEQRKQNDKT